MNKKVLMAIKYQYLSYDFTYECDNGSQLKAGVVWKTLA